MINMVGKTLIKNNRQDPDEIAMRLEIDKKLFHGTLTHKGIMGDMDNIAKALRLLLPKFQEITVFDKEQVSKLSDFIDRYDKFREDIKKDFDNRASPEDWSR